MVMSVYLTISLTVERFLSVVYPLFTLRHRLEQIVVHNTKMTHVAMNFTLAWVYHAIIHHLSQVQPLHRGLGHAWRPLLNPVHNSKLFCLLLRQ